MQTTVIIALGSNRRHGRHGDPARVIRAAVSALSAILNVTAVSRLRATPPMGPKQRGYVNAALAATSDLAPAALLAALHDIERAFGRRRRRKWGPRVLDLDLVAYGDIVSRGRVRLPHPGMHLRRFVLDAVVEVAPGWRHPLTGLTVRQMRARLTRPRPLRREAPACRGS
jgi:2-amino-4-hydroxy-6-hydroxymethyldihydropteridine diphosphokinase